MDVFWFTKLCRRRRPQDENQIRSVGVVSGFFFMINFVVGTGFLSVPYAFYSAGVVSGAVTLIALSFISWNTANWVVETMARAQALENWKKDKLRPREANSMGDSPPLGDPEVEHPDFTIRMDRKFELAELCQIFYGKPIKYLYMLILSIILLMACWSCTTVAGSAWSTNIPFNFSSFEQCPDEAFKGHIFPEHLHGCVNAYRFCVMIFALIVIPLSLLELTDQKYLQVFLGLMRFFTVICIVVFCVAKLITDPQGNAGSKYNNTNYDYGHELFKFDYSGWLLSIPVLAYGQILHMGIPSLTQPVKDKKRLRAFFAAVFTCTTLLYTSLGLLVSLWFKGYVQETCTLNFVSPARHSSSTALRVMSYYIIFFPSLDVSSAFPLINVTIANNLFIFIMGVDTSQANTVRYGRLVKMSLRVVCAVIPIIAALFATNLVFIVKYGGILGLTMCYFFPIALQLKSQYICFCIFRNQPVQDENQNEKSYSGSHAGDDQRQPLLLRQAIKEDTRRRRHPWWYNPAYSTQYATVLSHPVSVIVFTVLSSIACGLAIASLVGS